VTLKSGRIHQGDCIKLLANIEAGSVNLAFADPPFNIGYQYDVYDDCKANDHYLDWSRQWMAGVHRALRPDGTFWLAIGDEYAAELKLIAQKIGFTCRSWVIWYYTFGVNCTRKFNRSHAHLFHFLKDPKKFTFHFDDPSIRVPSARQLVYADARANPNGRLPDDTWILRPQDVPGGFSENSDTWYFPRVAGTFKERAGFHGCQMPEQLLGRIVRASSNKGDLVLDPFTGSGTTLTVAKKLGRNWIGFELSPEYVRQATQRMEKASFGEPLNGAADPLASAPTTPKPRALHERTASTHQSLSKLSIASKLVGPDGRAYSDQEAIIVLAYLVAGAGFSADQMLADPELNAAFSEQCKINGSTAEPTQCFHKLLNLRKAGRLPRVEMRRPRSLKQSDIDAYSFASEIAWQWVKFNLKIESLDEILCDAKAASEFDRIAMRYAPNHTPFEYRWAALRIRKRAKDYRKSMSQLSRSMKETRLPRMRVWQDLDRNALADTSGVYVICGEDQKLYVGETLNLSGRLAYDSRFNPFDGGVGAAVITMPNASDSEVHGMRSELIRRYEPDLNLKLLAYA
jgi:DNA modification methylase